MKQLRLLHHVVIHIQVFRCSSTQDCEGQTPDKYFESLAVLRTFLCSLLLFTVCEVGFLDLCRWATLEPCYTYVRGKKYIIQLAESELEVCVCVGGGGGGGGRGSIVFLNCYTTMSLCWAHPLAHLQYGQPVQSCFLGT